MNHIIHEPCISCPERPCFTWPIPGSEQAGGGDSNLHLISEGLFLTDNDKSEPLSYLISDLELSIFDGLAPGKSYPYN